MYKKIIYQYINRLSKEDIINFCNYKNISITNREIDTLYIYIKQEHNRFFDNPDEVLNEIKDKVSINTFMEIMKLYNQYKNKIKI